MYSIMRVRKESIKALGNEMYLNSLKDNHQNLVKGINSKMIKLKRHGHIMGCDLRNRLVTEVFVPNPEYRVDKKASPYLGVKDVKTIKLDHRITSKFIKKHRNDLQKYITDKDHIDNIFAELAVEYKKCINVSRILKQVELNIGGLMREYIVAIQSSPRTIEYY